MKICIALGMPLAAFIALDACTCKSPPHPAAPVAVADAGELVLDDAGDECSIACANMAAHGCQEARVSRQGEPCAAFCRRETALGAASQLHPECVADAGTHAAMQACGVRCYGWR